MIDETYIITTRTPEAEVDSLKNTLEQEYARLNYLNRQIQAYQFYQYFKNHYEGDLVQFRVSVAEWDSKLEAHVCIYRHRQTEDGKEYSGFIHADMESCMLNISIDQILKKETLAYDFFNGKEVIFNNLETERVRIFHFFLSDIEDWEKKNNIIEMNRRLNDMLPIKPAIIKEKFSKSSKI